MTYEPGTSDVMTTMAPPFPAEQETEEAFLARMMRRQIEGGTTIDWSFWGGNIVDVDLTGHLRLTTEEFARLHGYTRIRRA